MGRRTFSLQGDIEAEVALRQCTSEAGESSVLRGAGHLYLFLHLSRGAGEEIEVEKDVETDV
jgi:hypothetical protein